MGIKQIVTDDLTGKEIDPNTETTSVRVDGVDYEVYLSPESKETFLALVKGEAPLLQDARPARTRSRSGRSSSDKERNAAIRAWAQSTGFKYKGADGKERTLGDRGAIPQEVSDAYDKAN